MVTTGAMPVSPSVSCASPQATARSVCPGARTTSPRVTPRTGEVRSAGSADAFPNGKQTREFGSPDHAGACKSPGPVASLHPAGSAAPARLRGRPLSRRARSSGARVRLAVGRDEPVNRDVGVYLSRSERGVAEHLLHAAQVRAAFEEVRGGRVPQAVRAGIRHRSGGRDPGMNHAPGRPWVKATASCSQEQRGTGRIPGQKGPAGSAPSADRALSRNADRHDALLAALSEHPDGPAALVDVIDVQAAQFADPDAGCVEEFHDRRVAELDRGRHLACRSGGGRGIAWGARGFGSQTGTRPAVAPSFARALTGPVPEDGEDLIDGQDLWQLAPRLQGPEQRTRVGWQPPALVGERG